MVKFDKSRLPSRHVTEGPSRAPHRSYYYAMGLTEEEIHQPLVGVASCWNEAAPCNIALMRQAQSAKKGVKELGGTPREFCTITVTDGIKGKSTASSFSPKSPNKTKLGGAKPKPSARKDFACKDNSMSGAYDIDTLSCTVRTAR